MTIAIPDAFKNLTRQFHQDMMLVHATPEEAIASALKAIGDVEKVVVRQFLDELLSGKHKPSEIKQVWWETPAEIYFADGKELVVFLQLMRNSLG